MAPTIFYDEHYNGHKSESHLSNPRSGSYDSGDMEFDDDDGSDGLLSRTADEIQGVVDEGAALLQLINEGGMDVNKEARVKRRVEEISEKAFASQDTDTFQRLQLVPISSSLAAAARTGGEENNDPFGDIDDP